MKILLLKIFLPFFLITTWAFTQEKKAESLFLAKFKTHKPLAVTNPELFDKNIQAQIVLGIFIWQRPLADVKVIYPSITEKKYNEMRIKYQINNEKII